MEERTDEGLSFFSFRVMNMVKLFKKAF